MFFVLIECSILKIGLFLNKKDALIAAKNEGKNFYIHEIKNYRSFIIKNFYVHVNQENKKVKIINFQRSSEFHRDIELGKITSLTCSSHVKNNIGLVDKESIILVNVNEDCKISTENPNIVVEKGSSEIIHTKYGNLQITTENVKFLDYTGDKEYPLVLEKPNLPKFYISVDEENYKFKVSTSLENLNKKCKIGEFSKPLEEKSNKFSILSHITYHGFKEDKFHFTVGMKKFEIMENEEMEIDAMMIVNVV